MSVMSNIYKKHYRKIGLQQAWMQKKYIYNELRLKGCHGEMFIFLPMVYPWLIYCSRYHMAGEQILVMVVVFILLSCACIHICNVQDRG